MAAIKQKLYRFNARYLFPISVPLAYLTARAGDPTRFLAPLPVADFFTGYIIECTLSMDNAHFWNIIALHGHQALL